MTIQKIREQLKELSDHIDTITPACPSGRLGELPEISPFMEDTLEASLGSVVANFRGLANYLQKRGRV